jgi:hypothetical protein
MICSLTEKFAKTDPSAKRLTYALFAARGVVIVFFLAGFFHPYSGHAQATLTGTSVPDSVLEKMHSPRKATLMSLCLPGLGQVYNKKYWKLPIIYAGFGVLTYFIVTNANEYSTYRGAYLESVEGDSTGKYQDLVLRYSSTELLSARDYYRRNLEVTCLLTAVFYILNVLDATVDAHLFTYNISKDLSFKVEPVLFKPTYTPDVSSGIKLSFKF